MDAIETVLWRHAGWNLTPHQISIIHKEIKYALLEEFQKQLGPSIEVVTQ